MVYTLYEDQFQHGIAKFRKLVRERARYVAEEARINWALGTSSAFCVGVPKTDFNCSLLYRLYSTPTVARMSPQIPLSKAH